MLEIIMAICATVVAPIESAVASVLQFADAHAIAVLMMVLAIGIVTGAFYKVITKIEVEK